MPFNVTYLAAVGSDDVVTKSFVAVSQSEMSLCDGLFVGEYADCAICLASVALVSAASASSSASNAAWYASDASYAASSADA